MSTSAQQAVVWSAVIFALSPVFGCNKKQEEAPPPAAEAKKEELAAPAQPDADAALEAAAAKWIDQEFQPSTLTRDQQLAELKWFREAAKPYRGQTINVVSETIDTHVYESKTLAKAFEEITGVKVKHDLIQEGDVIEKLQTQMQSGRSIYDMYVNDSDLIGTHFRYG